MTTPNTPTKVRYEGNGVTDTFAFTGRIFSEDDLIVEIILRADDTLVDTLTLTTDYSVTIISSSSASVVVTAPNIPSSLQDIQIRSSLSKEQTLVLPTGTVFPAKSVETALDKIIVITQQMQEQLDRKAGIPATSGGSGELTFPNYVADILLAWSGSVENKIENSGVTASELQSTITSVEALSAGSGVRVSSNDTTVGFLNGKLVAGTGITLTENNNGGNETLTVSFAPISIIAAATSGGAVLESNNGTDCLQWGAGGGANLTAYGALSMNTANKIINMADPTNAQDAATKAYVDSKGFILQREVVSTTTYDSSTDVIPLDNTIPQIGEGKQILTYDFTPLSTTSTIEIMVIFQGVDGAGGARFVASMFKDSGADAISGGFTYPNGGNGGDGFSISAEEVSGSLTARTYSVRYGPDTAGTVYVNGQTAGARLGGVCSVKMIMTEYNL